MERIRVLFVCVHNSARSQMAEAFLNILGAGKFEAESAGLEPSTLNPIVVESMKDIDIDISQNKTKSVFDLHSQGKKYNYVITVCDNERSKLCPDFDGSSQRIHWQFESLSRLDNKFENKKKGIESIRDEIRMNVLNFVNNKSLFTLVDKI